MITEIKGNLLDTDCDVIAHGVNCKNAMGSGVAKVLFTKWPIIKEAYHEFCNERSIKGDYSHLLGEIQEIMVNPEQGFINCFTQEQYGYDGKKYVSYDAIFTCFQKISCKYKEVAIPRIGCGLAGGNWEIVKKIIEDAVEDRCHVKVYYL